jgi:uncharacterized protein (TIGR03435 family)
MRAALLLLSFSTLNAQKPAAYSPKFEMASIRRCDPKSLHGGVSGLPGRVTVPCATLKNLIDWTYGAYANGPHFNVKASLPIEGAPAWLDSDRFTVKAKAPGSPGLLEMFTGPFMQALLADRFKLRFHRETRDVPVYALTVRDGITVLHAHQAGSCDDEWEDPWDRPGGAQHPGPQHDPDCRKLLADGEGFDVYGATMREFAALIPMDRPVIDNTGIAGTFDIHFGSLHDLDLQPANGPQKILVIDHVERPSDN